MSVLSLSAIHLLQWVALSLRADGPVQSLWKSLTSREYPLQPSVLRPLQGKSVLITGATSGCGLEMAKILAQTCAHVIITARDADKGERALAEVKQSLAAESKTIIEAWVLEMESFVSIREFLNRTNELQGLDLAVLNAGTHRRNFTRTPSSYEAHLMVNYLAPCALMMGLLPVLARRQHSRPGRLLNVTSEGHGWVTIPPEMSVDEALDGFNHPHLLTSVERYNLSKLFSMMWSHTLASSLGTAESVEIASITPGICYSDIFRDLGACKVSRWVMATFLTSAKEGARRYIRALAVQKNEFHGQYFFGDHTMQPAHYVVAENYDGFRKALVGRTLELLKQELPVLQEIFDQWGVFDGLC